jgi:hypothetical protein
VAESTAGLPSRLIQLVARFRPDIDGVGEAALNLASALLQHCGIRSDILVYLPPRPAPELAVPDAFPFSIERLSGANPATVDRAIARAAEAESGPPTLLLHYVSYGYSPHGTPLWLASTMERFVRRGGRLITVFHELYALPRFPTRTFFTSRIQRAVFRRLLAASHAAFTSSEDFIAMAERDNVKHRPIGLIGICSNAGEPVNPCPLLKRARRLAVFGRFATRQQLYARHAAELKQIAEHLGIHEIADIGPVDDPDWFEANVTVPLAPLVRSYGTLPVPDASRLLEDSILGALSYSYALRGKSGVFAAYQAHATAILLFPEDDKRGAPEPGGWTLTAADLLALPAKSGGERLQWAATAAYEQYRLHRSARAMAQALVPALERTASAS